MEWGKLELILFQFYNTMIHFSTSRFYSQHQKVYLYIQSHFIFMNTKYNF